MNHMTKYIFVLFLSAIFGFFSGCGKKNGGTDPPVVDIDQLLKDGWAAFESQDYSTALEAFDAVINEERDNTDAYNGLGWSFLLLDKLDDASTSFDAGGTKPGASADVFAGNAFTLNALKKYDRSIVEISKASTKAPDWSFIHKPGLDINDLQVLLAENYFLLGKFTESLSAILKLNSGFTADPETLDGQTSMAQEIERLKLAETP